jgi:basic endochitinase B
MTCQTGTSYIVQPGDTLYLIAQRELGDGNCWPEIKNPDGASPNPGQLKPGQELCLPSSSGQGFAEFVSRDVFDGLFPDRNALYTYDGLLAAIRQYPKFCNDGTLDIRKREAAAFLANISHETSALVYVEELNPPSNYCDPGNTTYPCAPGKSYHGRGPMQLSWNYNYGACGAAIGKDLLHQPELVSTDSTVTFVAALWFWMTPQSPKTSCHEAIAMSGFGMTIDIINGGIECGKGQPTPQVLDRVSLYQAYAAKLGVDPGANFYC